ncbi:MAG: hypothetical protein HKN23_15215 [Verrucomicrobiales bacterium]|nr:hypothetical protein [Verrucomicrobiales bacterium]
MRNFASTIQLGWFATQTLLICFAAINCFPPSGQAGDVLHLKNGQAAEVKIESITDELLTYITEVKLPNGQTGIAKRTVPVEQINFIEFGPVPGELDVLEDPGTPTIEEIDAVWDKKFSNLHRPRSNAGKIGLMLGEALLRDEKSEFRWNRALELYDLIRETSWSAEDKAAARKGRLQALIRLGDIDTAIKEATQLASETEDATMLIEAKFVLAKADFERLQKLEEENPKWMEDDTILPERNRLYHTTVDQFLWPYLFHGTLEEQAARGLVAAGEVYRFAGKEDESKACFEDAVKLYPGTDAAEKATILLDFKTNDQPNETNDDAPKPK